MFWCISDLICHFQSRTFIAHLLRTTGSFRIKVSGLPFHLLNFANLTCIDFNSATHNIAQTGQPTLRKLSQYFIF